MDRSNCTSDNENVKQRNRNRTKHSKVKVPKLPTTNQMGQCLEKTPVQNKKSIARGHNKDGQELYGPQKDPTLTQKGPKMLPGGPK